MVMVSTIRRFTAAFRMELRQLCLHWAYLALHGVWAALLYSLQGGMDLGTARSALEGNLRTTSFLLLSLAALFTAAASASRGRNTRFAVLEDALPTGAEVMFGRWLAVVTALGAALLTPVIMASLQAPGQPFLQALLAGAPVFLLEGCLLLAFAAAGGWWLAQLWGGQRWLHPIMVAGWLGVLTLPEISRQPATELFAFMLRDPVSYEELWGRLPHGLSLWFDLFYVGLSILLLALTVLSHQWYRLRRITLGTPATVLLGAAVALAGMVNYTQVLKEQETLYLADFNHYTQSLQVSAFPWDVPEAVDRYELTVDMSDPEDPEFHARLTLRNRGSEPLEFFHLTLNYRLEVVAAEFPFEREGDFITLLLPRPLVPGETLSLALTYRGNILMYMNNPSDWGLDPREDMRRLKPAFFTTKQGVRLTTAAGWYPLAGRVWYNNLLGYKQPGLAGAEAPVGLGEEAGVPGGWPYSSRLVFLPPAAFQLKVTAPARMTVTSNLPVTGPNEFEAPSAGWVFLFASPNLQQESVGRVTIVAPRDDLPAIRPLVPEFDKALYEMARFFPDLEIDGVFLAVLDRLDGIPSHRPMSIPPVDQRLNVYVPDRVSLTGPKPRPLWSGYDSVILPLVADAWFLGGNPSAGDPERSNSLQAIAEFFQMRMIGGVENLFFPSQPSHLATALEELYLAKGEAAAVRLLNRLREEAHLVDQMSPEEVMSWLEEVGHR